MKKLEEARNARLINEAHTLLDRIEARLHSLVNAVKAKQSKKAA